MKYYFIILGLIFAGSIGASTKNTEEVKQNMLNRLDEMVSIAITAKEDMDRKDLSSGCLRIGEMATLLPKHLKAIGTKMNLFDAAIIKMEQESRQYLGKILFYQGQCNRSASLKSRFDFKDGSKTFSDIIKSLQKQKRRIRKSDTSYQNIYNYHIEYFETN